MSELPLPTRARTPKRDPSTVGLSDPLDANAPVASPVGSYFSEHKAMVDARRAPLARLGMDERHVKALAMPDAQERPMEPRGVSAVSPPQALLADDEQTLFPQPKQLPKRAAMRHDLEE